MLSASVRVRSDKHGWDDDAPLCLISVSSLRSPVKPVKNPFGRRRSRRLGRVYAAVRTADVFLGP